MAEGGRQVPRGSREVVEKRNGGTSTSGEMQDIRTWKENEQGLLAIRLAAQR